MEPDVVVLNEYVESKWLCGRLCKAGWRKIEATPKKKGSNQVLIASKTTLIKNSGYRRGEAPFDLMIGNGEEQAHSNLLHVSMPDDNLELVGLRRPIGDDNPEKKKAYFDWLLPLIESLSEVRSVFIGDFNYTFRERKLKSCIVDLKSAGWQIAQPCGEWSRKNPHSKKRGTSKIDHALVSSKIIVLKACYIQAHDGFVFAGEKDSISDHAVLSLEIR